MHKKIGIPLLCFFVFFTGCATLSTKDPDPEAAKFEKIMEFSGMSQAELFEKANLWAVEAFRSANSVIEYSNKDTGTISGKFTYQASLIGLLAAYSIDSVRCMLTVNVKDNKCRLIIQFSEVHVFGSRINTWRAASDGEFQQLKFQQACEKMVANFENYMNKTDSW